MDLMNPANPMNMVNPASPWYYVWNAQDDTPAEPVKATAEAAASGGGDGCFILFMLLMCVIAFAVFLWVTFTD